MFLRLSFSNCEAGTLPLLRMKASWASDLNRVIFLITVTVTSVFPDSKTELIS